MDLVLAHLPSMCDYLGSFLGVAKTKPNKTKSRHVAKLVGCLPEMGEAPGATPNTAKCENNAQS